MTDSSASLLDSARVGDCMRAGIFNCDPDTPARELAAMMSSLRIHAVVLRARPPQAPALISDLDLVVVIDEASAHPVGVFATSDILQAYAASAAIHDRE